MNMQNYAIHDGVWLNIYIADQKIYREFSEWRLSNKYYGETKTSGGGWCVGLFSKEHAKLILNWLETHGHSMQEFTI